MDMIGGLGMIACGLVLVGSAVIARRRIGEPVMRYGLIWAAILAAAFAIAILIDRHG